MADCYTCELAARRDDGTAPLWDNIYRSQHWDVVHHYRTALPGWLILVARRHIQAIDQLTVAEAVELGVMLRQVSLVLKEVTGCLKTYLLQFTDHPRHPHLHFHVVPRLDSLPEARRGANVLGYLREEEDKIIDEAVMNVVGNAVQQRLVEINQV